MKYKQDEILQTCYVFEITKGRKLEIDPWTLSSELWAKEHYGSYQALLSKIFPAHDKDGNLTEEPDVAAIIHTLAYKLNDESKKLVDEWRGNKSRGQFIADSITPDHLVGIAKVFYSMIRDSFPKDLKKRVGENAMQMLR